MPRRYNPELIAPFYRAKTRITNAQMLSIFNTPVTIIPKVPGYVVVPIWAQVYKEAGAYGLNGNTNFNFQWGPTTPTIAGSLICAGFLDQAGVIARINQLSGNTTGFAYNALGNIVGRLDQDYQLIADTANFTGAGGTVTATCLYTTIPIGDTVYT